MKYRLQEGRFGDNWKDLENNYPRDASDLESWIELGDDCDTHDGKYHFRILDENDTVVWNKTPPYQGVHINTVLPGREWLEKIRDDYGISEDDFANACRDWLIAKREIAVNA